MNREQAENFIKENQILIVRTGSHLYGYSTPESDEDFVGLFIAPEKYYLGLETIEQLDMGVVSKGIDGKNNKDAVDFLYHEFRKAIKLISENNPNMLELVFPNKENIVYINKFGQLLLDNAHLFPSQRARVKFGAYAKSQMQKMLVKPQNFQHINELIKWIEDRFFNHSEEMMARFKNSCISEYIPELENAGIGFDQISYIKFGSLNLPKSWTVYKVYNEAKKKSEGASHRSDMWTRFSYDLKFSTNSIRLLNSGKELLETGRIEFPLRNIQLYKDIRSGKFAKEEIMEMGEQLSKELEAVKSDLPEQCDFQKIDRFLINTVNDCWEDRIRLKYFNAIKSAAIR